MLQQIIRSDQFIFYLLAAEVFVLILLQIRLESLLKRREKRVVKKQENLKQLREEIKNGSSQIPVVKFEKQKKSGEEMKKPEKKNGYDPDEMAVLQEMMAEFFG